MIDKAYMVDVEHLRGLCEEIEGYSLTLDGTNVTITRHDDGDGINALAFTFPVVANLWIPNLLNKNPEFLLQVCLHTYVSKQVRESLQLEEDGTVRKDSLKDWERFWTTLETFLESECVVNARR